MRRKRQLPDTRLDWRNPFMPVLRLGYLNKVLTMFEVEPEKIQDYYERKMINHPAGSKHSEETKAKISAGGKGRKLSEETKQRMSNSNLNRTTEHKANHAAAMKKRGITPEHKQKLKEANMKRGYKYVD